MKKTIFALFLSIVVVFSSISYNTIYADAVGVSTGIGLNTAYLLMLALSGVSAENSESVENVKSMDTFLNDLKNYSLDLYYWFLDTSSAIAAGSNIVGIDAEKMQNFREWAYYTKGWNTIDTRATIGTTKFNVNSLLVSGSSNYFVIDGYTRATVSDDGYSYLGVTWYQAGGQRFSFVPSVESIALMQSAPPTGIAWFSGMGTTSSGITYGGTLTGYTFTARTKVYYNVTDSNVTWLNIDDYVRNLNATDYSGTLTNFNNAYYSGLIGEQDGSLVVRPVSGVDGVATSVDQSVVGAGTLVDDENGDVVIGGDLAINLQNIDIQALLKSLADGQITYQQLVDALGATAVNTATMTAEQIAELAKADAIAQAGTQQITGKYTVDLTQFFPFCIPFDLYHLIQAFNADPVAPEVTISLPIGYNGSEFTWEDYTLSLSPFDTVAQVVRIFEFVLFIIGLMMVTRKLIEG